MVRSQLQHNVLKCYKNLLVATKGDAAAQERVRLKFKEGKSIRRMDITNIEYQLRVANRRLDKLTNDHDHVVKTSTFTISPKK